MNETMMLPVEYLGVTRELPLTIVPMGYTYQLHVQIEDRILIFEKDDEGEYRVLDAGHHDGSIDKGLVAAIVDTLSAL